MNKPLLLLFDGNAIIHRAYHAFQTAKRPTVLTVPKTGEVVSAVYGFAQMLLKALNELKPTCAAMAFDTKAPTFRHEMFDQYKAHRPPTPVELINQVGRVRQMVEAFSIPIFELDGYEADDVLGTLSRQASEQGINTVIVTGDADTMQLVSPRVNVLYPRPGGNFSDTILYDDKAVKEKYGVPPEHIIDLKALVGDPSDNIPGVKGIGEKTAVKLIQQFGSIDQIYAHIDQVTPPRLQALLRANEVVARQCQKLATIVTTSPVTLNMDACQLSHFDRNRVAELFRELEFFSLLDKLPGTGEEATETVSRIKTVPSSQNYHVVNTTPALDELLSRLSATRSFAFDTETTGLNAMQVQMVGISISPAPGESYYIPVGHVGFAQLEQLPFQQVIDRIKTPFEDASLAKYAHNGWPADWPLNPRHDSPHWGEFPNNGLRGNYIFIPFDKQEKARYVRFIVAPQPGSGVMLSEVHVWDGLKAVSWTPRLAHAVSE